MIYDKPKAVKAMTEEERARFLEGPRKRARANWDQITSGAEGASTRCSLACVCPGFDGFSHADVCGRCGHGRADHLKPVDADPRLAGVPETCECGHSVSAHSHSCGWCACKGFAVADYSQTNRASTGAIRVKGADTVIVGGVSSAESDLLSRLSIQAENHKRELERMKKELDAARELARTRSVDAKASQLADECGRLFTYNKDLLAENATLRRELERLKGKGKR